MTEFMTSGSIDVTPVMFKGKYTGARGTTRNLILSAALHSKCEVEFISTEKLWLHESTFFKLSGPRYEVEHVQHLMEVGLLE